MTGLGKKQFFLGANSPTGFYSLYDALLPIEKANRLYIIKGGAGCGKSTLMRRVAQRAQQLGEQVEYILCSGDPDSLDAIVLEQRGIALVDGTSPHVVEPRVAGAVDRYVNLGACYRQAALFPHKMALYNGAKAYKESYQRAYHCLSAAKEILQGMYLPFETEAFIARCEKKAKSILAKEVKPQKNAPVGTVTQRFLSAITHKGQICLEETAQSICSRIYCIEDRYGIAHHLLNYLLAGAVHAGYDVIACPNPMFPQRLCHVLIPSLSLGFITYEKDAIESCQGKLKMETLAKDALLNISKPRLRFCKKMSQTLIDEAICALADAKQKHDALEEIYFPHIDFELADEITTQVMTEIFE